MLHQAPDQAEGQECRPSADEKPEVRTACALHGQCEQSAQGGPRDDVRAIIEQAWVEPSLPDDWIGVDPEVAQCRRDLLGDTQVNVAGWKCTPGFGRSEWSRLRRTRSADTRGRQDVAGH